MEVRKVTIKETISQIGAMRHFAELEASVLSFLHVSLPKPSATELCLGAYDDAPALGKYTRIMFERVVELVHVHLAESVWAAHDA